MKPIAKAMTAAICAVAYVTVANAASRISPPRTLVASEVRTISRTDDGFVIKASGSESEADMPLPFAQEQLIPVGTSVHLDARLLARPVNSKEENRYARR